MVVLEHFVAVCGLGLAVWVLGEFTSRPDVGFVGAIIVIGIAAAAATGDGIMVQTGVIENGSEVRNTYEPLATTSSFPFEMVVVLLGALMGFRSIGEMSEI